jgi:hypothetical protein
VWNEWDQPAHPHDGHAYAYSAGPGLRLVLPTVQHTIALDYVPLYYHPADRGIAWAWPWESLSLYLDLYF